MSSNVTRLVTGGSARFDIAAAVRAHLAVRKVSDSALGRGIGMSQSMVSRRTNGETAFDTDDLGRIAEFLGISYVDLIQMPTAGGDSGPSGGSNRPGPRHLYMVEGPEAPIISVESARLATVTSIQKAPSLSAHHQPTEEAI